MTLQPSDSIRIFKPIHNTTQSQIHFKNASPFPTLYNLTAFNHHQINPIQLPKKQVKIKRLSKKRQKSLEIEQIQNISHLNNDGTDNFTESIPQRKTRDAQESQSLRQISYHIKKLIQTNNSMTIKDTSYLLYEIMGKTQIGEKIINNNYYIEGLDIMQILRKKYRHEFDLSPKLKKVVKNVRRRVYDSMNVLIALGIFIKVHNTIKLVDKSNPLQYLQNQKSQKEELENNCLQKQKYLQIKKKNIQASMVQKNTIQWMINRNKTVNASEFQQQQIFHFPLLIMPWSQNQLMNQINNYKTSVISLQRPTILGDLECIEIICPQENSHFKKSEIQEQSFQIVQIQQRNQYGWNPE